MPNILKQVQDLGGICWDKYISGSGFNALYINSKLDECAVKQINFNSNFPIETGIDGYFNNTKIFTDYKNNYFAQKTTTVQNQSNIKINTSTGFADLKLNNFNGIFKEINLYTDKNKSNINLFNSRTKDIFIDTSDIPNNATAKFRCIKFDPNETERTCIKILSTKEILLKCCGSGEQGIGGGEGAGGGGGGGGGIGGEGLIGIGGPTAFGSDGIIGIDGPAYVGTGPQGLDGQVVRGDNGSVGLNNEGVQGLKGPDGDVGNTINGTIGIQGPAAVPNPAILQGDGGENGVGASIGIEGPVGIQNQGPYPNAVGFAGSDGSEGIAPASTVNQGSSGPQGAGGVGAEQNPGVGGIGGILLSISTFLGFGDVTYNDGANRIAVYGITGFLNPYNKNDITNNPVIGSDLPGPLN